MIEEIEDNLIAITQYDGICMQPASGATGEYAGLMAIKTYHQHNGDKQRDVCLVPTSAHGTNPASAIMCGMKLVPIGCDENGNILVDEVEQKASLYGEKLACMMITYPSTYGVFEEDVKDICDIVHRHGG